MTPALCPLASAAQIEKTPSREDGIPVDMEEDLRAYGCKLVHEAGVLLRQYVVSFLLSRTETLIKQDRKQVAVATAQILFQRFWYVSSMKHFGIGVGPNTSPRLPFFLCAVLGHRHGCAILGLETRGMSSSHA
jgi:hypothetical protein